MDPFLIPVQLVIIACYLMRFSLINRLPEPSRTRYTWFAADITCTIGTWWKTILVPIVLTLLAAGIWLGLHHAALHQYPEIQVPNPIVIYVIVSCIFAPIMEEILQGAMLSALFLIFSRYWTDLRTINLMMAAGLVFSAVLFAFFHENPAFVNWLVRFFMFVLYGGLYYLNRWNLLPAIVAHATWNGVVAGIAVVTA